MSVQTVTRCAYHFPASTPLAERTHVMRQPCEGLLSADASQGVYYAMETQHRTLVADAVDIDFTTAAAAAGEPIALTEVRVTPHQVPLSGGEPGHHYLPTHVRVNGRMYPLARDGYGAARAAMSEAVTSPVRVGFLGGGAHNNNGVYQKFMGMVRVELVGSVALP